MESRVTVDLWTDIVCPWCFIGVTRFERALQSFEGEADIRLHPFQLDPSAPVPGIPAMQRYAQKFGGEAPRLLQRVQDEAAKDGIEMRFDRAITANTFDAHRLLQFAHETGKQRELEMSLYRAYFSDGLDISDRTVLAERAAAVGIDREAANSFLQSDTGADDVRDELAQAAELGISGVPAFVFQRKYLVPGAVDTASFIEILNRTTSERA
jgi:predicted DsbA family dithiol-disulfide isomerase